MDGIQQITLSGEQLFQASLAMKSSTLEMHSSVSQAIAPTIAAFSDFDPNGGSVESANISRKWDLQKQIIIEIEQDKQDADNQENSVAIAMLLMDQVLNPQDYELNNWHVGNQNWSISNAGIQATIHRIENDLDGIAEEYGLNEDQKQQLKDLKDELKGKSGEQQQAIIDKVSKEYPAVTEAFMDDAEKQSKALKSDFDHKVQATPQAVKIDEVANSNNDSFDDFSNDSILTADFNPNAIGGISEIDIQVANVTPTVNYGLG